ncbi:hypothetical protein [Blastococcus montanus]|uniref:hypothetical protein n=1 Tax=Blastococcus montanus TaxID=3144973 RepID=UPI00320AA3A0
MRGHRGHVREAGALLSRDTGRRRAGHHGDGQEAGHRRTAECTQGDEPGERHGLTQEPGAHADSPADPGGRQDIPCGVHTDQ